MKLLVTGANGFLGREIVRQMAAALLQIRATDMQAASVFPEIDYRHADILEPTSLLSVVQEVDCVIHAAGLAHIFDKSKAVRAPFKEINEIGTANMVQAAANAGVRHFVLISSVSVYGGSRNGGAEDSGCDPQGSYAQSKYQAEQRAIEISRDSGMALTILRLATLYGEGDPGNVARLMRTIDRGRFLWIGDGSNCKSLLYRDDAARACLKVFQAPAKGVNIFNVSVLPCTMYEVVEGLAKGLGKKIPSFSIPASVVQGMSNLLSVLPVSRLQTLGAMAKKWLTDDVYDGTKFSQTFNFQPKVSLKEGLRREVAWFQEQQ
ncbi:MAG: NAD-dependent epimerase/dehydratase family protein [Acidobacteria bacterium]|nr:NAD-dependent epimerase/dehydratase family protein [Acidobacteriota bacterium]MBU4307791.1 NAD-dependent epimerase/dehydratase family protein [Acidobacteriota bacterium]MCG2810398.1 NAD-dependent epimerase/dehydratase family protein [Candidatus Aminicenantes bacterium]